MTSEELELCDKVGGVVKTGDSENLSFTLWVLVNGKSFKVVDLCVNIG